MEGQISFWGYKEQESNLILPEHDDDDDLSINDTHCLLVCLQLWCDERKLLSANCGPKIRGSLTLYVWTRKHCHATHIVLPNIENILNFSEEDLLQPDVTQPMELQHLDEIVEWATARIFTQDNGVNKIVRVQLKCDGTRWCTGGEVKGKLANGVGSLYSSHYLGTWCIQHYYRWCAHLGCQ